MANIKMQEEEQPFDLTAKVTIRAKKSATHHAEGEETEIHPNVARKLTESGAYEYVDPKDAKDNSNVDQHASSKKAGVMTTESAKAAK